jgi:hypothetical protein
MRITRDVLWFLLAVVLLMLCVTVWRVPPVGLGFWRFALGLVLVFLAVRAYDKAF